MNEDFKKQADEAVQQVEELRTVVSKLEEQIKAKSEGAKKEAAEQALAVFRLQLTRLMGELFRIYINART